MTAHSTITVVRCKCRTHRANHNRQWCLHGARGRPNRRVRDRALPRACPPKPCPHHRRSGWKAHESPEQGPPHGRTAACPPPPPKPPPGFWAKYGLNPCGGLRKFGVRSATTRIFCQPCSTLVPARRLILGRPRQRRCPRLEAVTRDHPKRCSDRAHQRGTGGRNRALRRVAGRKVVLPAPVSRTENRHRLGKRIGTATELAPISIWPRWFNRRPGTCSIFVENDAKNAAAMGRARSKAYAKGLRLCVSLFRQRHWPRLGHPSDDLHARQALAMQAEIGPYPGALRRRHRAAWRRPLARLCGAAPPHKAGLTVTETAIDLRGIL